MQKNKYLRETSAHKTLYNVQIFFLAIIKKLNWKSKFQFRKRNFQPCKDEFKHLFNVRVFADITFAKAEEKGRHTVICMFREIYYIA